MATVQYLLAKNAQDAQLPIIMTRTIIMKKILILIITIMIILLELYSNSLVWCRI